MWLLFGIWWKRKDFGINVKCKCTCANCKTPFYIVLMHIIYVKNWFYPIFHTLNVTWILVGLCLQEVIRLFSFLCERKNWLLQGKLQLQEVQGYITQLNLLPLPMRLLYRYMCTGLWRSEEFFFILSPFTIQLIQILINLYVMIRWHTAATTDIDTFNIISNFVWFWKLWHI